jgi:hypothetical protein
LPCFFFSESILGSIYSNEIKIGAEKKKKKKKLFAINFHTKGKWKEFFSSKCVPPSLHSTHSQCLSLCVSVIIIKLFLTIFKCIFKDEGDTFDITCLLLLLLEREKYALEKIDMITAARRKKEQRASKQ